jgi:hypothetical protein
VDDAPTHADSDSAVIAGDVEEIGGNSENEGEEDVLGAEEKDLDELSVVCGPNFFSSLGV